MNEESLLSPVSSVYTTIFLLPSLPLKSVTKVCVHLQSQHLFRDRQCMHITISHKDCYAGSILTGLRDIDLATLQPILSLAARVLFLCVNPATLPGDPTTLKSLLCPKGPTLGYTSTSPSTQNVLLSFAWQSSFDNEFELHFFYEILFFLSPLRTDPSIFCFQSYNYRPSTIFMSLRIIRRQSSCLTGCRFIISIVSGMWQVLNNHFLDEQMDFGE